MPCLDDAGTPVPANSATDRCDAPLTSNPEFHAPRTNTGVADFPGGDILVTLGAFADTDGKPVGTPFMQAGTFMHEWGHNAELTHGGRPGDPNCKPTYVSVMNYLYQLRGLLDDAGRPHLDFSRGALGTRARRIQPHRRRRRDAVPARLVRSPARQLSRRQGHRGGETL